MNYFKCGRGPERALGRGALALTVAALSLVSHGSALGYDEELVTDRPDFTESSQVVLKGRAQLEGGLTFETQNGSRMLSGPELLLRYGVLWHTEMRLQLPDYIRSSSSGNVDEHLGESAVGFKFQLGRNEAPFGAAVISHVTIPADEDATGEPAPEVVLALSQELPGSWSVGSIVGRAWLEGAGRGENILFPTFTLSRDLTANVGSFLEWAAEFPDHGEATHLLHHGYTIAIPPDGQFDVHFGAGLTASSPDFFIGLGFTARH